MIHVSDIVSCVIQKRHASKTVIIVYIKIGFGHRHRLEINQSVNGILINGK